jgi:hypothetical protein
MAHTCPDCGSYCTCQGDWDDMDMGSWSKCACCLGKEEDFDREYLDDPDSEAEDRNPNHFRNL